MMFLLLFSIFALQIPALNAPVMDNAGVLNGEFERYWNDTLTKVNVANDMQAAIFTIHSLEGEALESASMQIVDKWQLGKKESDKGLLIFMAVKEKKIRIEVGQGLEGDIPDAYAKRIISDQMLPYFRKGDFSMGMHAGLLKALSYAHVDIQNLPRSPKRLRGKAKHTSTSLFIVFCLMVLFLNNLRFSRRRNSLLASGILLGGSGGFGRGGSGGFGGGGFGGGGGGFSGGGASGSW